MSSIQSERDVPGAQPLGTVGWTPQPAWEVGTDAGSLPAGNGAAPLALGRDPGKPARDAIGYAVFSAGDTGAAHVLAHRLFDAGRIAEGHRRLGDWLRGRTGGGSDWVHLQFHMALFELELGYWGAAYYRFCEHVLPAAATSAEALTDAPALLWRLALTAPAHVDLELHWRALRATAVKNLNQPGKPFVELHNLLALAGAGDVQSLDCWLQSRGRPFGDAAQRLLRTTAVALRDYASGAFQQAAAGLESVLPRSSEIGGSAAQNQLFRDLAATARAHGFAAAA